MLTWGVAWTNADYLGKYLSSYNLTFLRFLIGFITLIPFCFKRILKQDFTFQVILNILITSSLFFLYNIFFFKGTDLGDSGQGGVFVTTTNPLITFVIATMLSRKFTINQLLNISLGVLGGLMTMDIFNLGFESLLNDDSKYFMLCSLIWGVMTVIMKYGQEKFDSISYITLCYLLTCIMSSFFIDISNFYQPYKPLDMIFIINLFFVSVGAMSFGTSLYIYAIPKIGPIKASVFIFLVPFIAITFAAIFGDSQIKDHIVLGGILSLISVYMINKNN